ncbi:lipase-like domain-containing protein [Staphylococcus aureus]
MYKTYTSKQHKALNSDRQKADLNMFFPFVSLLGNLIGKAFEKEWRETMV